MDRLPTSQWRKHSRGLGRSSRTYLAEATYMGTRRVLSIRVVESIEYCSTRV